MSVKSRQSLQTKSHRLLPQVNIRGYNLAYVEEVEFCFHGSQSAAAQPSPAQPAATPPPPRIWACAPLLQLNSRLSARCEGPFGLLRGGLEVRLRGSCFRPVAVQCHSDRWRPFEALAGHRKRYEAMPVAALLERVFAYREIAAYCRLVCRERGGLELHADLPFDGRFGLPQRRGARGIRPAEAATCLMASAETLLGEPRVNVCVRDGMSHLRRELRRMDYAASGGAGDTRKACEKASQVTMQFQLSCTSILSTANVGLSLYHGHAGMLAHCWVGIAWAGPSWPLMPVLADASRCCGWQLIVAFIRRFKALYAHLRSLRLQCRYVYMCQLRGARNLEEE